MAQSRAVGTSLYPCVACGIGTNMRCSGCSQIYLCSKACMKLIWKEHKGLCQKRDGKANSHPKTKKKMGTGFLNSNTAKSPEVNMFEAGGEEMFCLPCAPEKEEVDENTPVIDPKTVKIR